ncbi:PP2C family protein-serine/threonine phosphatase [Streptomyces sp. 8K308]|uniref:PP2C family protein-serine/threonine phosphatase n=1 Tax=Streptomyces sp. 8K308 TaxID=2530388 RepID=UPI0014054FDB|nr:PP2C family protein-serine/threonine phosphatase [Streptomyces sp. 8K308]
MSIQPSDVSSRRAPTKGQGPRSGWMRLLPVGLIITAVLYNILTPTHLTFLGLYVAAPLIAAAVDTPRATLATAVVSIAIATPLLTVVNEPRGLTVVERCLLVGTVVVTSGLALVVNAAVIAARERAASAFGIAEVVQRAVVPHPPPRAGSLRGAAHYRAAQQDTLVGGDLYATQETPFGVRLIVGDVSGKGVRAAMTVAVMLGAFREWSTHEPDLAHLVWRLEHALLRENQRMGLLDPPEEGFVTAVLAEFPHDTPDRPCFICCGHPPPLLLPPDEPPRYLPVCESALPFGLGRDREALKHDVHHADLPAGTFVLLYTDGVTEARNGRGEFYDPAAALGGRVFHDPDDLVDAVTADIVAHTHGNLNDDVALLAVHHTPDPAR